MTEHMLVLWFTAEECADVLRIATELHVLELIEEWTADIRDERADPTGIAYLRYRQERARRKAATEGTLGQSEFAQALAKAVRIYLDDEPPPPQ